MNLNRNVIFGQITLRRLLVALILVAVPVAYFYPAVKGEILLAAGDAWLYSLPLRMLSGQMLRQGTLPLWNPYTFAGMPLLAATQPGVLYPPNWLFAVLSPGAAINAVVISAYQLTLVGTYLYARVLRLGRAAALLAAVSFTFGGFMISLAEQINFIAAAAWLPWLLWVMEKVYRASSWREAWGWTTGGAVIIALHTFAGLPQATVHVGLVGAAYFGFQLFARRTLPPSGRMRFVAAIAMMVVCGALLSALQLLPARELQLQGERAALSYEAFATFSMPPRRLLSFIAPYFFGGALPGLYHVPGWDEWWLHKFVHGYVGLLTLPLAALGAWASKARRLAWFWVGVAVVALLLSFGSHLPFQLHRLLYHVPIYNLFRGPYRHLYEFSFALAMLAGLGMDALARGEFAVRRLMRWCASSVALLVVATVVTYRFFAHRLGQPPAGATALGNAEILVPLSFFIFGLIVLWLYARRPTNAAAVLVIAVLLADLTCFGWFTYWRSTGYAFIASLDDPPAIKAIKAREPDLSSFRIVSQAPNPYYPNYEPLCHGNMAIPRSLQSAAGYDPMRLIRMAQLAGEMDIFGVIGDQEIFSTHNYGLDLLNVKYLLRERKKSDENRPTVMIAGVRFPADAPERTLNPKGHLELEANGEPASELIIISSLANSAGLSDESPVARVRLHTKDGQVIEADLRAGRDTAEWAYDRPDVRAVIRHHRAPIAESFPADGFEAHRYLARIPFTRSEIERVELDHPGLEGDLVIARAVLCDTASGRATPVESLAMPGERWRRLGNFTEVELYENLRVLPRAWFASNTRILPGPQTLSVIQQGYFPDGVAFAPTETALLEEADAPGSAGLQPHGKASGAEVNVIHYEPGRIELITRNAQAGLLVLSETFYPGWIALIDGREAGVERVNYALRGVTVPGGEHQVEFVYRPRSLRQGALCFLLGMSMLGAGFIGVALRLTKTRSEGDNAF